MTASCPAAHQRTSRHTRERRRHPDPTFDEVIEAARHHDTWAFSRLYESLAPTVHGYLRAQGVREAEDVTSEVFIAVLSSCSSFQGDETQFRRWVFTIAHRRIVDTRRSDGRRPNVRSFDESGTQAVAPGRSPAAEEDALRHLGTERIRRLLSALSTDQRCVLALRVVADLSIDDVAVALHKPPGAVKALQRRALASLRRRLSQEKGDGDALA
ncbi:MAG: RNA polymerase sigma factor [Actinobacteria bacterium]|nr:RNA polymerase sigma factor [Actinomycetota bacterium]